MIEDARFNTVEKRFQNKNELEDLIEDGLRQADSEDWLALMHEEDIAAGPVHSLDKAAQDPQVVHNRTVFKMGHPLCGEVRAIECPIKFEGAVTVAHIAPPLLGEHTEEVLRDVLGYSVEKIEGFKQQDKERGGKSSRSQAAVRHCQDRLTLCWLLLPPIIGSA